MGRALLRFVRERLEGLAVALLLPFFGWCAARGGGAAVRRAWPRWRRLLTRGLRDYRERWWIQTRLEPASCLWRYALLAECAALMPPAGGRAAMDRMLLLCLGHIGDVLHAAPGVRAFRKRRPETAVDVLVGPWSERLAARMGCFDAVLVYNPRVAQFNRGQGTRPGFRAELASLRRVAARRYRVVVSAGPLHFAELAVVLAARPREFRGVVPDFPLYPPSWDAAGALPFDSRMREADWIAACLEPGAASGAPYALEYPLEDAARRQAVKLLADSGVAAGAPYAVLAPGAGWPGKQWPPERFAELADWLAGKKGWRIVLAGSPGEHGLCERVRGLMKAGALNLAGRTSLDELAAVLERAAVFAGNDSGPMHIAAAVGTPTITFWGPTFPEKWAPRGPRHLVVRSASPCAGCIYWHPRAACTGQPPCIETAPFEPEKLERFLGEL